jgi:hypothetical protein
MREPVPPLPHLYSWNGAYLSRGTTSSVKSLHLNYLPYVIFIFIGTIHSVQNSLASFGLYRLVCGSFTKDHNISETVSVSVLRQGRPTQLGPSECYMLGL